MNKEIIKIALDALEIKLIKNRQEAKRDGLEYDIESINSILDITRRYQKDLENKDETKIIIE